MDLRSEYVRSLESISKKPQSFTIILNLAASLRATASFAVPTRERERLCEVCTEAHLLVCPLFVKSQGFSNEPPDADFS